MVLLTHLKPPEQSSKPPKKPISGNPICVNGSPCPPNHSSKPPKSRELKPFSCFFLGGGHNQFFLFAGEATNPPPPSPPLPCVFHPLLGPAPPPPRCLREAGCGRGGGPRGEAAEARREPRQGAALASAAREAHGGPRPTQRASGWRMGADGEWEHGVFFSFEGHPKKNMALVVLMPAPQLSFQSAACVFWRSKLSTKNSEPLETTLHNTQYTGCGGASWPLVGTGSGETSLGVRMRVNESYSLLLFFMP